MIGMDEKEVVQAGKSYNDAWFWCDHSSRIKLADDAKQPFRWQNQNMHHQQSVAYSNQLYREHLNWYYRRDDMIQVADARLGSTR